MLFLAVKTPRSNLGRFCERFDICSSVPFLLNLPRVGSILATLINTRGFDEHDGADSLTSW